MARATKQRARSDDEKAERRGGILAAARAMYEREPSFAAFTMSALADRAGLAKGTLYLYFRTKEEVFLALVEGLFDDWFDDVDGRLDRARGEWTAERAAALLVETVRERRTLVRLLSILGTIVEQNVEPGSALRYKLHVMERSAATGARLERRLPFLAPGRGARLLVHLHALVIGLWQLAEPSPVIREVMARPEMEGARVDFERDLSLLLRAVLDGMRTESGA